MMKKIRYLLHIDHLIITISAFLLLWLLGVITFSLDILNPVADALDNFSITDVFFDIEHSGSEPEQSDLITLVDMTELHKRGDIASLIEDINLNDPILVGVDLIFEGVKDDYLGNELLEGSVQAISDRAIFSKKLINYSSESNTFTGSVRSFFIDSLMIEEAYTNLNDDMAGNCIRDFSIKLSNNGAEVLSFPAKIAAVFDESVKTLDEKEMLINYRNVVFPVVKWDQIAEKSNLIEGHIVLIGTMTEEQDMHMTPLGKMPGLELQAYSLLTLLEHKNIKKVPGWLKWLFAFLVCYLLEVSVDALNRVMEKRATSVPMLFFKEANLLSVILLFVFIVITCGLFFFLFTKHGVLMEGGVILALLALVYESRDLYEAFIHALNEKYNWGFVKNSLFAT